MILFWVLLLALAAGVGAFVARPLMRKKAWLAAALAGLTAPAVAIGVYIAVGSPTLATLSGSPGADEQRQALEARVAELQAAADAAPDDVEAWRQLAAAELALPDYVGAASAFEHLMALTPEDLPLKSAWAEATVLSRGGVVTPEAREAFEAALAADPTDIRARFYLAEGKYQGGRQAEALTDWAALAEDAEPGAPWLVTLARRLERALQMQERSLDSLGLSQGALGALEAALRGETAPRGPSAADVAAAEGMTPEQQQAMVAGMVGGLAARLEENPDDLAGWRMAARSYQTLGRYDDYIDALAQVVRLAPDDDIAARDHAYALWLFGTDSSSVETISALEDLLVRDGGDPIALLGLADHAKGQGDIARARRLLTRLADDESAPEVLRAEAVRGLGELPAE